MVERKNKNPAEAGLSCDIKRVSQLFRGVQKFGYVGDRIGQAPRATPCGLARLPKI
jgi:hypothetical protein